MPAIPRSGDSSRGRFNILCQNENIAAITVASDISAALERQEDVLAVVPVRIAVIDAQNARSSVLRGIAMGC